MDETHEKIVEAQKNHNNGDSNTNNKCLKYVSFPSMID